MELETREIYSEVYQLLNFLGDSYINKLPKSLFNMLKEKRDTNYNPQYTEYTLLSGENIKKETISIMALLYLNYWCESKEEKRKLEKKFANNEKILQQELQEKYNPNDIFKKNNQVQYNAKNIIKNQTSIVEYKESILKKVLNKIKAFFINK